MSNLIEKNLNNLKFNGVMSEFIKNYKRWNYGTLNFKKINWIFNSYKILID